MADCEKYLELISAAADGELSKADRSALEKHLELCPECRKAAAVLVAIKHNFPKEAEVPANFTEGTMAKIRAEAARPTGLKRFISGYGKYTGLAAALVVVLLGAHVFTNGMGGSKSTSDTAVRTETAVSAPMAAADSYNSSLEDAVAESAEDMDMVYAAGSSVHNHNLTDGADHAAGGAGYSSNIFADDSLALPECEMQSEPVPMPSAEPSAPQFTVTVEVTDIENLYKRRGYTERFYSVSKLCAPAPEELGHLLDSDGDLIYSSSDEQHYSVPVSLLHELDPEAFTEIVFDDLTAKNGLVILMFPDEETED